MLTSFLFRPVASSFHFAHCVVVCGDATALQRDLVRSFLKNFVSDLQPKKGLHTSKAHISLNDFIHYSKGNTMLEENSAVFMNGFKF